MGLTRPPKPERVYVKVTSDFDATGFMQPRTITWRDGRVFKKLYSQSSIDML